MALDHQQIAWRTRKIAEMKAERRGKKVTTSQPVQVIHQAQIEPGTVYTKQRIFELLHVGNTTWKKWKERGLKPFRAGKQLAIDGASLIAVMQSH